jgi:hypothetical protein
VVSTDLGWARRPGCGRAGDTWEQAKFRHYSIDIRNLIYSLVVKKDALINCILVTDNDQKMGFSFFQLGPRLYSQEEPSCLQWI